MKIYSLIITGSNGVAPIYEVHSWEKAEEIIRSTMELTNEAFTFEVVGRVEERQGEYVWVVLSLLLVALFVLLINQ